MMLSMPFIGLFPYTALPTFLQNEYAGGHFPYQAAIRSRRQLSFVESGFGFPRTLSVSSYYEERIYSRKNLTSALYIQV